MRYPPWRTAFRPAEHLEDESSEAMRDMRTSEASAGRSSESEHRDRASTRTVWMARNSRGETTGQGADERTAFGFDAIVSPRQCFSHLCLCVKLTVLLTMYGVGMVARQHWLWQMAMAWYWLVVLVLLALAVMERCVVEC